MISGFALNALGFELADRIVSTVFSIMIIIVVWPRFKAMDKKLVLTLAIVTLVPAFTCLYAIIFRNDSVYWLYGSAIFFLASIPTLFIIITIHKRKRVE